MDGKKYTLIVDEETQGYRKEFKDISSLVETVTSLIDDHVVEIQVKRKGIAGGNPLSHSEN